MAGALYSTARALALPFPWDVMRGRHTSASTSCQGSAAPRRTPGLAYSRGRAAPHSGHVASGDRRHRPASTQPQPCALQLRRAYSMGSDACHSGRVASGERPSPRWQPCALRRVYSKGRAAWHSGHVVSGVRPSPSSRQHSSTTMWCRQRGHRIVSTAKLPSESRLITRPLATQSVSFSLLIPSRRSPLPPSAWLARASLISDGSCRHGGRVVPQRADCSH